MPCPTVVLVMVSPLRAIRVEVPVEVPSARFTVSCQINVNSPRWVAIPVAVPSTAERELLLSRFGRGRE